MYVSSARPIFLFIRFHASACAARKSVEPLACYIATAYSVLKELFYGHVTRHAPSLPHHHHIIHNIPPSMLRHLSPRRGSRFVTVMRRYQLRTLPKFLAACRPAFVEFHAARISDIRLSKNRPFSSGLRLPLRRANYLTES